MCVEIEKVCSNQISDKSLLLFNFSHFSNNLKVLLIAFDARKHMPIAVRCTNNNHTHTIVAPALGSQLPKNKDDYQKPQLLNETLKMHMRRKGLHLVPDQSGVKARDLICIAEHPTAGHSKPSNTHAHRHGRAKSSGRGKRSDKLFDYSINRREYYFFVIQTEQSAHSKTLRHPRSSKST